jgi:hypothetical protein
MRKILRLLPFQKYCTPMTNEMCLLQHDYSSKHFIKHFHFLFVKHTGLYETPACGSGSADSSDCIQQFACPNALFETVVINWWQLLSTS